MRIGFWVTVFVALAVASTNFALAASRAEFDQLVTQLQAKPSDNTLRERIIKMSLELTPAPAIPESARQNFLTGAAIAKGAANASGQKLAIKKFQEALKIAPWWGDAYYNLAIAQELAGQFESAKTSLQRYIMTKPGEKDAREAQDRIYTLDGKIELAKAAPPDQGTKPAKTSVAQAAAPPPPAPPSFDGARFVNRLYDGGGTLLAEFIIEVHGNQISDIVHEIAGTAGAGTTSTMACVLNGLSCNLCCGTPGTLGGDPASRYVLDIAADGRTATRKFYLPNGSLVETRVYDRQ